MSYLFKTVLQMSITASYVIAVVIVLRMLMRRYPKKYSYYLWSAVFFRLCCPFSFSSVLSIFNFSARKGDNVIIDLSGVPVTQSRVAEGAAPLDIGAPIVSEAVQEAVTETVQEAFFNPEVIAPAQNTTQQTVLTPIVEEAGKIDIFQILSIIWVIGVAVLAVYALISYIRVRKSVELAVPLYFNVMQADIQSPFLLGLINPVIYVPFNVDWSVLSMSIAHERYHQYRKDHWIRVLSYCLLCLHWMNPLCWLAYNLMVKDMEMSCDEHVLSGDKDIRAAYSTALLSLSTKRMSHIIAPVTFGGADVKERVRNIMHFKRRGKLTSVIAALLCVLTLVSCAFNGKVPEVLNPDTSSGDISGDVAGDQDFGPIKRIGLDKSFYCLPSNTSNGLYQISTWNNQEYRNIIYTDYATQQTVFLCNIPGCAHNSPNCTSYISADQGGDLFTNYSEDHLYLINYGREADDRSEGVPASIIEMNMDGSDRRTICVLPAGEEFGSSQIFIAGDEYMYIEVLHFHKEKVKVQVGTNEIETERRVGQYFIERLWFKDGRRETVRELRNDDGGYETLIGTVDDKYLVINRYEPQESGSMITKEIIDQNGKTVSMEEPYSSEEYDYHDDHFRIKIEREGDSAAATVWIVDSGEKKTVFDIPYPENASRPYLVGGYNNKFFLSYNWVDNIEETNNGKYFGHDQSRALVLDFSDGTWKDFTLYTKSNESEEVFPVAEAGNDYLVRLDRSDSSVIDLVDSEGVPHSYQYYGRITFALMSKDDYWNSVPNYRIIEDKLG